MYSSVDDELSTLDSTEVYAHRDESGTKQKLSFDDGNPRTSNFHSLLRERERRERERERGEREREREESE